MCKRLKTGANSVPDLFISSKAEEVWCEFRQKMADERKIGVSFSFSKKSSNKAYSAKRNALYTDDVKVENEEKDYIHAAEGKELKRLVRLSSV